MKEILDLAAFGANNEEIVAKTSLAAKSVQTYWSMIRRILGVATNDEAVSHYSASRNGWSALDSVTAPSQSTDAIVKPGPALISIIDERIEAVTTGKAPVVNSGASQIPVSEKLKKILNENSPERVERGREPIQTVTAQRVPSVGDIVLYYMPYQDLPRPRHNFNQPDQPVPVIARAAIVTDVITPGDPNSRLHLLVIHPSYSVHVFDKPFSTVAKRECWSWKPLESLGVTVFSYRTDGLVDEVVEKVMQRLQRLQQSQARTFSQRDTSRATPN